MLPAHRRAIHGVGGAGRADFLAVVEVRRARQRGLQRVRDAPRVGVGHEMREAVGVVVLERAPAAQDELDARVVDHVAQAIGGGDRVGAAAAVVEQRHAHVHVQDAVERAVPAGGRVPDLADDERAGLLLVGAFREFAQEMRPEVARDVEAPAVDPVAQVRAHGAVGVEPEMLAHLVALDMEVGQVRHIGPSAVAVLVLAADEEPRAIRAVRIAHRLLEVAVPLADMVEHAVEHDLEAACVRVADQHAQVGARAVFGADLEVIRGVVLVVGVRAVDRVQIEHIRVHRLEVRQAAAHALQVAAPEVDLVAPHARALDEVALRRILVPVPQPLGLGIEMELGVEIVALREAIDEHLVDDRTRAPVGVACGETFMKVGGLRMHGREDSRARDPRMAR